MLHRYGNLLGGLKMIIIPNPFWIALEAINITIFLLLWRIISIGRYGPQLEQIKEKAEDLMVCFGSAVDRIWYKITQNHLSQRGRLVLVMLLLMFGQFVLYSILGWF